MQCGKWTGRKRMRLDAGRLVKRTEAQIKDDG